MTDRYLYVCPVPNDAQSETGGRARQHLAEHGLLDSDSGAVEAISTEPGEQDLRLTYVGQYAEKLAAEVDELANNSRYEPVPYFASGEATPADAYYALKAADVGRADPQTDAFAAVDVTLTREGTRDGKRRAVHTTVRGPVENPWGNDETAYLGLPSAAMDAQWLNPESGQTESVSIVETRAGEYGDVDVVDAQASSFTNPTLVFDIAYSEEWQTAVHAFDTQGYASKTDADGILQWMRVFRESHDFSDAAVISNRLVRLQFDEGTNSLSVEEWDDANSAWSAVALGTSDWEFDQLDVTRISPSRVGVQCRFIDPSVSPTAVYHLDMSLKRGYWWPQWTRTASATDPVPSGLVDLLSPVADGSDYEPQGEQGLVDRGEVRD